MVPSVVSGPPAFSRRPLGNVEYVIGFDWNVCDCATVVCRGMLPEAETGTEFRAAEAG